MRQANSPYETSKANSPSLDMPTHGQEQYRREDELRAQAPPTVTYPLDTLIQFVGNMLVTLTQARTALNVAGENPEADKNILGKIIKKLDEINMIAISIPEDLETLRL